MDRGHGKAVSVSESGKQTDVPNPPFNAEEVPRNSEIETEEDFKRIDQIFLESEREVRDAIYQAAQNGADEDFVKRLVTVHRMYTDLRWIYQARDQIQATKRRIPDLCGLRDGTADQDRDQGGQQSAIREGEHGNESIDKVSHN